MRKRVANLTHDVRIYGAGAEEIALRYRNRETSICPILGIVQWKVKLTQRRKMK